MSKRYLIALFLGCCINTLLGAASVDQNMAKGNAAYQSRDFKQAIQIYESLLAQGFRSEALYYNLGNAYFRTDQLGLSILNYERALLLDPNDREVLINLEIARKKTTDQIEELPEFFLTKWWGKIRDGATSSNWATSTLVLFWITIAGWCLWILGTSRKWKKVGFLTGVIGLIVSMLPLALGVSKINYEKESGKAVILEEAVILRSGADNESSKVLELHEGTSVFLLDQIGDWHKVRLRDGEEGWLPKDSMEKV